MSNYKVVKYGTKFSPHILEDETGHKIALCACGGTHNADCTCDGTHNKKKDLGCECEFCQEKPLKDK